jgi:hypothetical protein
MFGLTVILGIYLGKKGVLQTRLRDNPKGKLEINELTP